MVAAVAIDEVSVKVVLGGKVGYYLPQGFLAVGTENMVYKLYDDFGYLIIKDDSRVFKCTYSGRSPFTFSGDIRSLSGMMAQS